MEVTKIFNILLYFFIFEQGQKRPQICIKCNKRGTFGERKREKKREKECGETSKLSLVVLDKKSTKKV